MQTARALDYELETMVVLTRDAALKRALQGVFASEPYHIEFYGSSNNFLQAIMRRPILVCVYDIGNARKDKMEFLPIITRVKPDISLIVIAGDNSEKVARKIHLNRIHYYFPKPVDNEEMLIAVRSAFEFHRRRIFSRGW